MKVLITGTSYGIGRAMCDKFLANGHIVIGIDKCDSTISHKNYTHIKKDIFYNELPDIDNVEILINNAGVQLSDDDIDVNLKGTIKATEKYAFNDNIKSVLFIASSSGRTGSEFPHYVASKGGMIAYMKNIAIRLAKYNATSNSLSPGGVLTDLNKHIIEDENLWNKVMDECLLKKWASTEEIAEFAYFMTVINKSMTAQDILVDNGEANNYNFVW